MRKILSLLITVLFCTSMFAAQEGTLTVSPDGVINPATEVTLNYDGTGTNFDKWEPKCFIYAWLIPADGQEFSRNYADEWIACQGDDQYADIADKRKMAFVEKGKYSIQINIKEYFDVEDEDLNKIARMGVVVCTQWVGGNEEDNNKTKDFFLDVNESQEPIIEPNFFVTGDSALVVDAGFDKAIAWKGDAIASYGDTIKLNLKAGQEYQLKVVAKGEWKGFSDLTKDQIAEGINQVGLDNIGFKLAEAGEVQIIYTAELFKLVGNFVVPVQVLEDGFYLISKFLDWNVENLTADLKFAPLENNDKEYILTTTLTVDDAIKVVKVEKDKAIAWYPDGNGTEFVITEDYTGEHDIYFSEDIKEDWKAFGGYFWMGKNEKPIIVKDLKLVPGVWASDNARLAVWAWGKEVEGAWSVFSGEGDTLVAKINEKADSVIFARLDPEKDIEWAAVWNKTINLLLDECGLFFVNYWDQFSWCEAAEPILPAKFYITGSANLVGEEKAWTPDALKVTEDSYTFEKLAAGKYQMKVVDANKENWYNIGDMSEVAAGLYRDQDANICFILAEEGDVKVTYKKEDEQTLFVLEGAFVAPEIQLMGINGWEAKDAIALEPAEDGKSASKTLELTGEWYDFKVVRAGEWLGKKNEGEQNYTIHSDFNWVDGLERDAEGVKSISLQPSGNGDYTFTYDFVSGKLTVTFPQAPEPVLANGYYLIGVINGAESTWDYASLKAENLFTINAAVETTEEYSLSVTLAENDEIQVVRCDNDALGAWYPGGEDKNYKVDAEHAGQVTIYFRPNRDGGDDWWEKCFFVASDEPSGVENTNAAVKAVKTLKDGQLIIEKNGKRYNVLGAIVR